MAKLDAEELARLYSAIRWSEKILSPHRKQRAARLRMITGRNFGDYAADDRTPLPLAEMMYSILTRQLVSACPQVLSTTKYDELKAASADLEIAINHLIRYEIDFVDTLRRIAGDSMVGFAVAKVGLTYSSDSEYDNGFKHDQGQPFCDPVLMEDLVIDMRATRWDQVQFVGDKYEVPLSSVLDNPDFSGKAKEAIKNTVSRDQLFQDDDERSTTIQRGDGGYDEDESTFIKMVTLMDIWLPRHKKIVTLPLEENGGPALREFEWEGPEDGPYYPFFLEEIPGVLLPLPPLASVEDIHVMSNMIFNKVARQAERQKTLLVVGMSGNDDARTIVEANDGDTIPSSDPANVKEVSTGGPNMEMFTYVGQLRQLFSYFGGNLDALGGLGAQSETVGQDRLLAGQASQRIKEMQDRMVQFAKKLVNALGHYLWYNKNIELPLVKPVAGTDIKVPFVYDEDRREGDYLQYSIELDPYTFTSPSPSERAQTLTGIMTNAFIPMAPLMQQMGLVPDMQKYIDLIAKYANMPEIKELVRNTEGLIDQDESPIKVPSAGQTTRRYERISRAAGGTMASKENVLSQLAMGGNPQKSQQQQVSGLM